MVTMKQGIVSSMYLEIKQRNADGIYVLSSVLSVFISISVSFIYSSVFEKEILLLWSLWFFCLFWFNGTSVQLSYRISIYIVTNPFTTYTQYILLNFRIQNRLFKVINDYARWCQSKKFLK